MGTATLTLDISHTGERRALVTPNPNPNPNPNQVLEPWGDAKRMNRLIFIGKNLNRDELTSSFKSCLVQK